MANKKMSEKKERSVDMEKIASGVRLMLEGMGEDPDREGLLGRRSGLRIFMQNLPKECG